MLTASTRYVASGSRSNHCTLLLNCLNQYRCNSILVDAVQQSMVLSNHQHEPSSNIVNEVPLLDSGRIFYTIPSIFKKYGSNRPNSICFVHPDEESEAQAFPLTNREQILAQHPYYKLHHYSYNSLRVSFARAGFKRVGNMNAQNVEASQQLDLDWNVYWGRHLPIEQYIFLNAFQKVNHFPGSTQLGRKDFLNVNLSRMLYKFGPEEYGFFPRTYLLPYDETHFKERLSRASVDEIFILKPFAGSCGKGISLMRPKDPLPEKPTLIQEYIHNPYLINGHKFDLRLYVCASSMDPMRLYLHEDGLVRFATKQYDRECLDMTLAHLTNYSLNKYSTEFVKNSNADNDDVGHKWSLKALKKYLEKQVGQERHNKMWNEVHDLIVKTMISVEERINFKTKQLTSHRNPCFELYGFDVMFDENLKPWLIEVNILPSLACASPLDKKIKLRVLSQMFHLLGVLPYDRNNYDSEVEKLLKYDQDRLTPESYILHETEDELARAKEYKRIFPPTSGDPARYNHLFTTKRENNELLLDFERQKRNAVDVQSLLASIA